MLRLSILEVFGLHNKDRGVPWQKHSCKQLFEFIADFQIFVFDVMDYSFSF